MSVYEKEKQLAIEAVAAASKLTRRVQASLSNEIIEKNDKSPVTIADFASQALVGRLLAEQFPADPFIAEEDAAELKAEGQDAILAAVVKEVSIALEQEVDASQVCAWIDHQFTKDHQPRFWTLDPIDGTKGFIRKDQYAISLALIIDGVISVGALACPNLEMEVAGQLVEGVILAAIKGQGCEAVAIDNPSLRETITVSDIVSPAEARFCESYESGHSRHDASSQIAEKLGIMAEPVRIDSQAKYAMVARGDAQVYLRLPTRPGYVEKIWDHAGGVIAVEEAGGTVTDIHGQSLSFTHGALLASNKGVVVSNGKFHKELLAVVEEVLGL